MIQNAQVRKSNQTKAIKLASFHFNFDIHHIKNL